MKIKQQIERKFLIKKLPDLIDWRKEEVEQWYLTDPNDYESIRVRRYLDDNRCYVDIIHGSGLKRDKYSKKSNWRHFDGRMDEHPIIKKTRYKKKLDSGILMVVDIFDSGLQLIEIESYDKEYAITNFDIPDWFGDEVTDNFMYSNAWIAHNLKNNTQ